jgi:ribosome-binding factor A
MTTRRQRRLNELLFEELSLLIPGQLDDPRLVGATVTRIEATQDLTVAKVYVTGGGESDAAVAAMLTALDHAQGQLRDDLGGLGLRRLPRLVFARDKQYESGERVLAVLDEMAAHPPAATAGDAPNEDGTPGVDASQL